MGVANEKGVELELVGGSECAYFVQAELVYSGHYAPYIAAAGLPVYVFTMQVIFQRQIWVPKGRAFVSQCKPPHPHPTPYASDASLVYLAGGLGVLNLLE